MITIAKLVVDCNALKAARDVAVEAAFRAGEFDSVDGILTEYSVRIEAANKAISDAMDAGAPAGRVQDADLLRILHV